MGESVEVFLVNFVAQGGFFVVLHTEPPQSTFLTNCSSLGSWYVVILLFRLCNKLWSYLEISHPITRSKHFHLNFPFLFAIFDCWRNLISSYHLRKNLNRALKGRAKGARFPKCDKLDCFRENRFDRPVFLEDVTWNILRGNDLIDPE